MPNKQVKISETLHLLKTGYTRWEADAIETGKSIEHYFGLSSSQSRTLFAHPKIKRIKTFHHSIEIIDDTAIQNQEQPGQQEKANSVNGENIEIFS